MAGKIKQEFVEVFVEESLPLAEQVAAAALRCEALWSATPMDVSPLRGMRAALHTIKGNAGMVGFADIAAFVHAMESATSTVEALAARDARSARLLVEAADLLVAMAGNPQSHVFDARTAALRSRLESPLNPVTQAPEAVRVSQAPGEAPKAPGEAPKAPGEAPEPNEPLDGSPMGEKQRNVRVNFLVLEGLLDGLGEAASNAAALTALSGRCSSLDPLLGEEVERRTELLTRELRRLRQLVTGARLVPVGPTFARFAHLVRTLSRSRGVDVRWVERGASTLVDKAILDRLGEPLLHVIRNAIAHGIEPPSERRERRKPATGTIQIEARLDRDRLSISITDDGRGIDVEAVRRNAASRGVAVGNLNRAQLLRLVFLPGLTTTATPDSLSGRGVGLDAVEMVVRELDGSIQVDSEIGQGTRFELLLPTTTALLSGLVFRVEDEEYAVATQHVVEAVAITADCLHEVNGGSVFSWRELLPAVDARDLLQAGARDRTQPRCCIVLEVGGERCGLLVSGVVSRMEGLVKSLDRSICYSPTISGATILPNGQVLPILDARMAMGAARNAGRAQPVELAK